MGRYLDTSSDSELLLNVLADEIHRAHQRCLQTLGCDPASKKVSSSGLREGEMKMLG
jgi:amidophosphoribosyltransferase